MLDHNITTVNTEIISNRHHRDVRLTGDGEVLPGVTVQATYVGNLIIREVPGININAVPPGVAGEPLNKSLGISAGITSEIPLGTGHYNALQIQTKRRFSNGGSVGANYTWSRSGLL